jgi:hypothetical protein
MERSVKTCDTTHEQHTHEADGADACMITKDEAAGLAGVTPRTIELWVSAGHLPKYTKGPAGYWVRFCREEVQRATDVRPATEGR